MCGFFKPMPACLSIISARFSAFRGNAVIYSIFICVLMLAFVFVFRGRQR